MDVQKRGSAGAMGSAGRRRGFTGVAGAVMVETSITAVAFFLFMFLAADVGIIIFKKISLQYVLNLGARSSILGRPTPDPDPEATREEAIKLFIANAAKKYGIELDLEKVHVCTAEAPECVEDYAGGPDEIMVIRAEYDVKLPGAFTFPTSARVIARSERYDG